MKDGISRIAAERQRQLSVEGWTPEHDDKHGGGALARAAAQYAIPYGLRAGKRVFEWLWPWDSRWYKPSAGNRIRELEKAGALIAAEIDRLLRLEAGRASKADSVSDAPESAGANRAASPESSSLSEHAPKPESEGKTQILEE